MTEIDIAGLNLKQLADLRERVDARSTEIGQQEKINFLEKMKAEAKSLGLDLEDVLGAKIKIPRKKKPPKYENPNFNPETNRPKEQFWTGHGRKPAWAVAWLEDHDDLDGCLIAKPAAKKTASKKPVRKKASKKT